MQNGEFKRKSESLCPSTNSYYHSSKVTKNSQDMKRWRQEEERSLFISSPTGFWLPTMFQNPNSRLLSPLSSLPQAELINISLTSNSKFRLIDEGRRGREGCGRRRREEEEEEEEEGGREDGWMDKAKPSKHPRRGSFSCQPRVFFCM